MKKKKVNHPLAEALANVGKTYVHTLPKEKNSDKLVSGGYYYPPSLRLDNKDYPGVEDFSAGQIVNLAITCEVESVSTSDNGNGKDYTTYLKVTQISDITPKKGG